MNNKCQKYESLFIFSKEEELLEHIKTCPDCQKVHEKMEKISSLIKEVAPHFKKEQKRKTVLRAICASFLLVVSLSTGIFYNFQKNAYYELTASSYLEESESFISNDFGFPVDEYGLLMVD